MSQSVNPPTTWPCARIGCRAEIPLTEAFCDEHKMQGTVGFFIRDLLIERQRQDKLHPSHRVKRPDSDRWRRLESYCRDITEEVGEFARAIDKAEIGEEPFDQMRTELIQVAALCLRVIQDEGL